MWTGERLQERPGQEPLANNEWERRHVERELLRLARPVEEGPRERLQPLDRVGEAGDLDVTEAARPGEDMRPGEDVWRVEPGCLVDLGDQPPAELSCWVVAVPVERGRSLTVNRSERPGPHVRLPRRLMPDHRTRAARGFRRRTRTVSVRWCARGLTVEVARWVVSGGRVEDVPFVVELRDGGPGVDG